MRPHRSLLFVPGHKPPWVDKALRSGTDAVILDLEDSVPVPQKEQARADVRESIERLRASGSTVGVFVRPNAWETGLAGDDVLAVLIPGLDGLLLPKVYNEVDVLRFDTFMSYAEAKVGIAPGSTEIIVSLETAEALSGCERLAMSSPRVVSMLGATARDADVARAVGYKWTREGLETLHFRSRAVLACRAAGLDHPLCGVWQDVGDITGLIEFSEASRQLGCRGAAIIHPSHARPVNEVFTPSADEVGYYRGMIAEFEASEEAGHAAVAYVGSHIDYAHVKTAREVVAFADEIARRAQDGLETSGGTSAG